MGMFDWLFGSKKREPPRRIAGLSDQEVQDLAEQLFREKFGGTKEPQSSGVPKLPQPHSTWKVINPRIPCQRPFHLLQRVFVFASGDANQLSASILAGYLQDAAENTLEEILKQVGRIDQISNSMVEAEINRTGRVPASALEAMAVLAPQLIEKVRNGEVRICARTFDDSQHGQSAAVLLLYRDTLSKVGDTTGATKSPHSVLVDQYGVPISPSRSVAKP